MTGKKRGRTERELRGGTGFVEGDELTKKMGNSDNSKLGLGALYISTIALSTLCAGDLNTLNGHIVWSNT